MVWILVGLCIGVLLNMECGLSWNAAIYLAAIPLGLVGAYRLMRRKWYDGPKAKYLYSAAATTLFAGVGIVVSELHQPEPLSAEELASGLQAVVVVRSADEMAFGTSCIAEVQQIIHPSDKEKNFKPNNLKIRLLSQSVPLQTGDRLQIPCRFRSLLAFRDSLTPFLASQLRDGVCYSMKIGQKDAVRLDPSHDLQTVASQLRDRAVMRLQEGNLDRDAASLLATMMLGDRSQMPRAERTEMANGGIAHILAVSGLHVGIVAGLLLLLTCPLNALLRRPWAAMAVTALLLWGYVLLTGLQPSAQRAALMFSVAVLAVMLQRKTSLLQSLVTALVVIVILDPVAVYDPGLQLSALCMWAIATCSELMTDRETLPAMQTLMNWGVVPTVVTTLASWALSAYYFHRFPTLFLLTNLIAMPLAAPLLGLGLAYLAFGPATWISAPLEWTINLFAGAILNPARFAANYAVELEVTAWMVLAWLAIILLAGHLLSRKFAK